MVNGNTQIIYVLPFTVFAVKSGQKQYKYHF